MSFQATPTLSAAGNAEPAEGRVLGHHWSAGPAHGALPTTLQGGLQSQMVYDPEGDGADLAFPLSPLGGLIKMKAPYLETL